MTEKFTRLLCICLLLCGIDLLPVRVNAGTNLSSSPTPDTARKGEGFPVWGLGPFIRSDANPILTADPTAIFHCPILDKDVRWEARDIVAAAVYKGQINLVFRADPQPSGTLGSRQGLAWSNDGVHFTRLPHPVLYPENDAFKKYEWPGGTEDGRVVELEDGTFIEMYPAFDGHTARQCVATSRDLRHWTKHGPVFAKAYDGRFINQWSKSGSIVSRYFDDGRVVAAKIAGKYWMYVGDRTFFVAWSTDLINWTPVLNSDGKALKNVLPPRRGLFDSDLTEPGPPPIVTPTGILVLYNGRNSKNRGNSELPNGAYSGGQALFDANDPTKLIARCDKYFITPTFW